MPQLVGRRVRTRRGEGAVEDVHHRCDTICERVVVALCDAVLLGPVAHGVLSFYAIFFLRLEGVAEPTI